MAFGLAWFYVNYLAVTVLASPAAQGCTLDGSTFDPCSGLSKLFKWIVAIASGAGALFFAVDIFKHLATSPRNMQQAGWDAVALMFLLGVMSQAENIVKGAGGLFT